MAHGSGWRFETNSFPILGGGVSGVIAGCLQVDRRLLQVVERWPCIIWCAPLSKQFG
jgi:hypothetical protein